jgi:hypothetical protein
MFDSGSITSLPLDPELLKAFVQKLPPEVVEQFINNWRTQTLTLERNEKDSLLLLALLRRQKLEKQGLSGERLPAESDSRAAKPLAP